MKIFAVDLEHFYQRLLYLYTYRFPVRKGKWFLFRNLVKLIHDWPTRTRADLKDGRQLVVNLRDETWRYLYFFGHRQEVAVDQRLSSIVRRGDLVLDIGANIGVTATWFAKKVGLTGEVHAFEPNISTFELLSINAALNNGRDSARIILNQLAVGEDNRERVSLYSFRGLGSGMASLSTRGRKDSEAQFCKMVTLDSYLTAKGIGRVDFVKCDAEGADLFVVRGSRELLRCEDPPIWLIEVVQGNTQSFGYDCREITNEFMIAGYRNFYWITGGDLVAVDISVYGSDKSPLAEDILCVPESRVGRLAEIGVLE